MINSRTKELNSFRKKILGKKYTNPSSQIQDFTGIRIVTYVDDEIRQVCELIESIFDIDIPNSSDKSETLGIDKVGYKSVHYIANLKSDRLKLPEYKQFEGYCFEIQVRTILQHAWAEIEHDRNYKFTGKLPTGISRRFKLLAGSLEMADREFNNISREIDEISKGVKEETEKGNLDIELNSTSLSQFLKTRFSKLLENGFEFSSISGTELITEMQNYGLNTLKDLNNAIPEDFIEAVIKNVDGIDLFDVGLVRMIMIVNDYNKYFTKAFNNSFSRWANDGEWDEFFEYYGIDWENDINEKFKIPIKTL